MKKQIIFSSYDDMHNCFYGGGGAQCVHEVARRLGKTFAVTVITGNYKGASSLVRDGVSYKRIGPSFAGPRLGQLIFHMLLPFYVRQETYDVWIESFTPPFSTSCLQLFTKKPVIGLVHMLSGEDMKRKYKLPFDLIEKIGLKTYKRFIVLTEAMREKVTRENPKAEVSLIPNGVVMQKSFVQADTKNPSILFMGRLEYNQKGLDLLVDAYKTIANKTKAKLIIAGSGLSKDRRQLTNHVKRFGLEKRIDFVGKATGEEKKKLFQDASCVAVPSRFETFGMVALEAMSFGKPLVGFAIDGLQWVPEHSMLKAQPFAVDQLGALLQKVLTDKKAAAQMGVASRKYVKAYAWEAITEKYEQIIRKSLV